MLLYLEKVTSSSSFFPTGDKRLKRGAPFANEAKCWSVKKVKQIIWTSF